MREALNFGVTSDVGEILLCPDSLLREQWMTLFERPYFRFCYADYTLLKMLYCVEDFYFCSNSQTDYFSVDCNLLLKNESRFPFEDILIWNKLHKNQTLITRQWKIKLNDIKATFVFSNTILSFLVIPIMN